LSASDRDVIWLYAGTDNGFDSLVNGSGNSTAAAESTQTSIGLNGYTNGVDAILGQGDTVLIDSNSSHSLDLSQTTLTGIQGLIAGGGNDVITASDQQLMVIEAGAGNDTLIALGADVTWIYQGTGNGFDTFVNGDGTSVAQATAAGTVIGVNGYDNGVDEFLGLGDTIVRDTNSSHVLDQRQTIVTGIAEIDGAGGNDTIVTSALSNAAYRGGTGNDTFVVASTSTTVIVTVLDFETGNDQIDLSEFGLDPTTGFADLIKTEQNGDTVIDVSQEVQVRLVDLALASLMEDDFLF
jgi:hypothetical protein